MSKALGSGLTLEVSTNAGSTYTAVGNIKSVDFPLSVNAVDSTDNDDSGNKTYLAGDFDGSASVTFNYDPADAGQVILLTNFLSKTTLTWRYRPTVGSTLPQFVFNGLLTEHPVPASHESVIEVAASIQITAGVTKSAQT